MKKITKYSKHFLILAAIFLSGLTAQSQTPGQYNKAMKEYYANGDYVNATLTAMAFLRTKGRNKNAQKTLAVSFNLAVEGLKNDINDLMEKSKIFSGDETINERKKIIKDYELLESLDRKGREILMIITKKKVSFNFDKIDVSSKLDAAQKLLLEGNEMAADMHYKKGLVLMNKTDRESQKSAAKEFKYSNYESTPKSISPHK